MTYEENKLVQIIGAICAKPKLLIMDEPKNYLTTEKYRMVLEDLSRLNRNGVTIVMAVDKFNDLKGYCNRYAYLKEGALAGKGKIPGRISKIKIVTVRNGNIKLIEKYMAKCIAVRRDERIYLYKGDVQMLFAVLYKADCEDCMIEDMTLEERIDRDFSRWI